MLTFTLESAIIFTSRKRQIFQERGNNIDFKTAVTSVLKSNYANFNGRARRSEYWYFWLFSFLVSIVCTILTSILGKVPVLGTLISIVTLVISLLLLVPGLAVAFRRLHDTGKSGWWILIALIPLVGEILLIVFFATDSQPGENKYGPNPKGM